MRVDEVVVRHVSHPLAAPLAASYGSDHRIDGVIVGLRSGDVTGWAEANAFEAPTYSGEYARGVFEVLRRFLAPRLRDATVDSPGALRARLAGYQGNPFARAALEMAWWTLDAALQGVSLAQRIGDPSRPVRVNELVGLHDTVDRTVADVTGAVERGFEGVKMKFAPGHDIAHVREARRAYPKLTLQVDCNGSFDRDQADVLLQLDRLGLLLIEQPFAPGDLVDHAWLQERAEAMVAIDESATSLAAVRAAVRLGACRAVNVKPVRVGGLGPGLAMLDLCAREGLSAWVGTLLDTALGTSACLALATHPAVTLRSDLFPTGRFHASEVFDLAVPMTEPGVLMPVQVPAGRIRPVEELLAERTLRSWSSAASRVSR